MSYNEQETRFYLIDPVLRDKGYNDHQWLKLETPAPVKPTGPKGRRRKGPGRTDYLLCVQVGDMPKPLPVGVLEAKKETEDPLKGMQQAKGYADCRRFEVKYVFATNGHRFGEFDFFTNLQNGPFPFVDFPSHPDLTGRYAKDTGIDVAGPEAAIHIGLTATPRQLHESKKATTEDQEITANNHKYFGEPVYEYTLIQAQEDGYLAACEIVKRKASIDNRTFTKAEILAARAVDIRTGRPLTEADLTKEQYTGKDFDDQLFIELRSPKMCEDLFQLLCRNGGPEQKVIIFCNREIHADRVAQYMNNLYTHWCRENKRTPKDRYAFKCMGGPNNGSDMIESMRGSGERAFIACTVDLLEAGVDIERLNAVVFFRYLQSPIKFYQMVGRGTRIHEETEKYKFWLYDYTDVTSLFGTDFITKPPRPSGGIGGKGGDGPGGPTDPEPPSVAEIGGQYVTVTPQGRFILSSRDGRETPIPVDEYRREVIQRVLSEAHSLDEFRKLWIETQKRHSLIDHLLGDNFSPEVIREIDQMNDFDLYDFFGHHGYHARALKRIERGDLYISGNQSWFDTMDGKAAIVLKGLGHQFGQGGTDALETPALWEVPEIKLAGGLSALRGLGKPVDVMHEAKGRLFGI